MQHCDALIVPRWCVPVVPAGVVLEGHAVAVSEGRIDAILPLEQAQARYQPSALIERPDHVLMPGLVNAHTHAAMTLFRGLADDMHLEAWLRQHIWPAERRWVSAELVRDGTELAIAEMLRGGTTCFGDQYFFPEIVAQAATDLSMRAVVATPVADFKSSWAGSAAEYLQKGTDLVHDPYAEHPLITTAFAPHSTFAMADESFAALRVLADQLDLRVQIHLHESAAEIRESLRDTGKRPFARLDHAGLVNRSLLAVHAVHLDDEEVDRLAAAGVSMAHCPKSNLKLANGVAPVAKYRSAGINVALGTDGAASNNMLDMFSEMQTAALLGKTAADDATAVSAQDALDMATMGGARALRLDRSIGSIEQGKLADLVCVDFDHFNTRPVYDVVSQLVYATASTQVSDAWVGGRHQLENGRLTQIDGHELVARADEWRDRIAASDKHVQEVQ
ncbi:MAG: TRZ/ATZ family hydrolase [Woeseiaceae bacterium]|nr:TRZ/ATZ family hydrolase [Gammaproteobacteria bacterium]NNF50055.1 TRZ/ATZ family hydrolase [Woeseiaceae bacterium]NNK25203.1 TRZ/ATZ family hydrolase [Woeseiaceae bacterium]